MDPNGNTSKSLFRPCVIVAVLVTLLPLLYFFPATSGNLIISPDDGVIQNIPFRVAVADMIRSGYAPLWNPYLFCGMPLFAAAQAGVLFPLNWFYLLFPPAAATNLMMLATYMAAALGAYLYARRSGASIAGAAITSLVWQGGGFLVNQIGHTNITHTAALLPWLLWAIDGYGTNGSGGRGLLVAALVALQCFAGHQQTFVYTLLLAAAYVLTMWRSQRGADAKTFYLPALLFLAAGLALAAVQIVPTLELLRQSLRADASYDFFTSFSMPRNFVWTFFAPYVAGGGDGFLFRAPYVGPSFYAEYVGYVGLTTLILAVVAIALIRDSRTRFWGCVTVIGLVLALGRYAPLSIYKVVYAVPILNLFRVPARHLMEVQFALAVLAGRGLTAIIASTERKRIQKWAVVAGGVVLVMTLLAITLGRPAMFRLGRVAPVTLLRAPELFLPPVIAALSAVGVWLATRRGSKAALSFLVAIVVLDLNLWGQFSGWRVASPTAHAELWTESPVFKFMRDPGTQTGRARILTQDHFFDPGEPVSYAAPVAAWSLPLQPDIAMMHRLENAAGYEGFGLARYSKLAGDMKVWGDLTDPERTLRSESRELDLLNVRYLLVRSTRDSDGNKTPAAALEVFNGELFGGEKFARGNLNLPGIVAGERLSFSMPGTEMDRFALLTTLAFSENAPDQAVVARIRLRGAEGQTSEFELHAGQHSSEWAYDRRDIQLRIKHQRAPIATSYPVQDGDKKFDGHDYVAVFALPQPMTVTGGEIVVEPVADAPKLMLTINRVSLLSSARAFSLRPEWVTKQFAAGKQTESDRWKRLRTIGTVDVFENTRALPRAWLAGNEHVAAGDEQIAVIRSGKMRDGSAWNPLATALVESSAGLPSADAASGRADIVRYEPNRVEVKTESPVDSLLVLADNHYSGWRAKVDGARAKVVRANYNQRAVRVPAGAHQVIFVYQPKSVLYGLIISVATLLALVWWARRTPGAAS